MRLFANRSLSLILCVMLSGFVIYTRAQGLIKWLPILAIIFLFAAFIFTLIKHKKKTILIISAVGLLFSIIASRLYFDNHFYVSEQYSGEVTVEGTVYKLDKSTGYSTKFLLKTKTINGKREKHNLSIYIPNETADYIDAGDLISFNCTLEGIDKEYASYQYAKGISATCEDVGDIRIIEENKFVFSSFFDTIREKLSRYSKLISDSETGSMVSALLLGERDMLSEQTQLDFRRIGITHMLALSGMHLAILSLALEKILRLIGVKYKARAIITIVFTVLYMLLTGLPVSVKRAGIMLIISSLLKLVYRDSDPVTSLFIAVSAICITTPYSIFDISLWLSAFATLGVIISSEIIGSSSKETSKIKSKFIKGLLPSIFAISATIFITQFSFDGFSIVSPISTLIFGLLVEIIMYLGGAMLIIGKFIPIKFILAPIVKFTTFLASKFSSANIYVSKTNVLIYVFVLILCIAFFVFIFSKIKKKALWICSLTCLLFSIYLTGYIVSNVKRNDDIIVYNSEEKLDSFIIRSKGEIALISSGQYSINTGYSQLDYLENQEIFMLDKYVAIHYSRKLTEELKILLSNVTIDKIYVPTPANEDENSILKLLEVATREFRTKICIYSIDEMVSVGDYNIIPVYSAAYGKETSQNAFMISNGDKCITYISSGMLAGKQDEIIPAISQSTDLVFGKHGKKYKDKVLFTMNYPNIKNIYFNSSNLYIPSHVTFYYIENGCKIYSHPQSAILYD